MNDTLPAAQLTLYAVPGVAFALTLKLLIDSYRAAAVSPAKLAWKQP